MPRIKEIEPRMPRELREMRGSLCFLGIGGSGMYSLAFLCAHMGFSVFGYDRRQSENVTRLRTRGISVFSEAEPLPEGVGALVYSLAVPPEHPILTEARRRGLAVYSRTELLGLFTLCFPTCIAVSGSHGKSTTTAMCAAILRTAGLAPTVLSGADLSKEQDSFSEGEGEILLLEACEYRDAFLSLSPTHAICLNASFEHTDYFPNRAAVMHSFASFLSGERVRVSVAPQGLFPEQKISITFGKGGSVSARDVAFQGGKATFLLCRDERDVGQISLRVVGEFQVDNALSAAAVAFSLGISDEAILRGLNGFCGIPRRMEYRGQLCTSPLYLDFAHHPRELFFTIRTAEAMGAPVALVFEPHTYTRTKAFFDEYIRLLRIPHMAGVLPIYAARETDTLSVSSEELATEAGVAYLPDYAHAAAFLVRAAGKGCTLLLVGAGSVPEVLTQLPPLQPSGGHDVLV